MDAVGFAIVALCMLVSASYVVRAANLIHAVLWLGVTLLTTAALYAMLGASFLAGVQALVYVGGVVTLMIFGVMITRKHDGLVVPADSGSPARGALVGGSFFALVAVAIRATPGLDVDVAAKAITPADLGRAFLGDQVLAFETLSVLLLGAMVGAIVIARRHDPGAPRRALGSRSSPVAARTAPEEARS